MDQVPIQDECNNHFLIDSGTKRILVGEESEQSQESTLCDIKIEPLKVKERLTSSLLDKSFSVEEEDLCTPLEPTAIDLFHLTPPISQNSNGTSDESASDVSCKSDEDDGGITEEEFVPTEGESQHPKIIDPITNIEKFIIDDKGGEVPQDLLKCLTTKCGNVSVELVTIPETNKQETDEVVTGIIKNDQILTPSIARTSILRRPSNVDSSFEDDETNSLKRKVSFPTDDATLISYKEPENTAPWLIGNFISAEEILQVYENSCKKHKTIELDTIKSQIQDIKNNTDHSATLKLNSIKITSEVNETLEDVLKVTNFHTLILHECKFTPETMSEFLNILEYYESVCHFEISMNFEDDDTWKCFCSACSNIMVLESLSFKGMVISEPYMRNLLNAVKNNSNITTLKFDGCMLVKLPSFYLVESLMSNKTLRELYLPSTGLYTKEADALQRFLVNNTHLKVLDISNNFLGDRGLEVLAKGLCKQNIPGSGLSVLVIFNNQITEKSGPIIKNIITECKNLHTLNIGYNNLTDEVLKYVSEGLPSTQSLEGLGLQCTLLTCKGIAALAEAIPNNESLQKINLKSNKAIQVLGVETLCNALTNSKITKIEIDDANRSCSNPQAYSQLVKKLHAICEINKSYIETSESDEEILNISLLVSRKVSLSCEPKYSIPDHSTTFQIGSPALSPIPSPVSSPASKGRFHIVKVPEANSSIPAKVTHTSSTSSRSRFRVTRVLSSPDEDISLGRFSNVRSSVSSNDSVDSLQNLHLESDSE